MGFLDRLNKKIVDFGPSNNTKGATDDDIKRLKKYLLLIYLKII
jgi:hypothetical protein